jgi:hypothetical protein
MQWKMPARRFEIGMIVAAVGLAGTVHAQTRSQFSGSQRSSGSPGDTHTVDTTRGWLRHQQSTMCSIWLAAGRDYAVGAGCEGRCRGRRCRGLDLVAHVPNGAPAAWDQSYDRQIMRVMPQRSGLNRLSFRADWDQRPLRLHGGLPPMAAIGKLS